MNKSKINKLNLRKKKVVNRISFEKNPILKGNLTGYPSIDKPWLNKKKYDIDMPDANMTVYQFLYECNKNHLDDIALIYDPILEEDSTNITYRQLFKKIDDCAKAYIALGIKKGDIVTVSLPSFVENIVSFYALNKIGAVSNQIHPMASQDEIDFYLEEAESTIFLGYGDVYNKIDNIKYDRLKKVILVSPTASISLKNKLKIAKNTVKKNGVSALGKLIKKDIPKNNLYISWNDFIKMGRKVKDSDIEIATDSNALATLTHTSGTTGKSKGVMSDSLAFNSSVRAILQETNLFQRNDKELLVLPPFPLYILNNVVHLSLSRGIQLIVVPKVDYSRLSKYFEKHHPNHLKGVPATIESILHDDGFDNIDLSDFKFLISGGGKLNKEQEANEFLKNHHCRYTIANGYGMSEVGGCLTCMFDNTIESNTVGRPLVGTNAKAVDIETNQELKYTDDKNGEIWISSPAVMKGYYKNPKETDQIIVKDSDGQIWIKTGDLGRITEEGNIKLVGRIKRMTFIFDTVTNTASKVSHDYVETSLCENKHVEDCVVVAVPNKRTQHALKAYILLKDQSYEKVIGELDKMCKIKFRKFVSPIEYVVVDNIPKTAAGKNDYRYIESFENGEAETIKVKVLYKKEISER